VHERVCVFDFDLIYIYMYIYRCISRDRDSIRFHIQVFQGFSSVEILICFCVWFDIEYLQFYNFIFYII